MGMFQTSFTVCGVRRSEFSHVVLNHPQQMLQSALMPKKTFAPSRLCVKRDFDVTQRRKETQKPLR